MTGLGAQRPVGRLPGGGPRFSRETGGKRARGESFSPLDSLLWFGGPWGGPPSFSAWPAAHLSHARNGPPPSWAGWERQEFWDPLRWAPKIGGCTPNRASEAGTLGVSRVFCPARVRAKNRLDFIPALARAGSLRRWVLLYPKPSPRGEGGPAKPGRMRGRSCTQPFLVEKRRSPDCRLNEVFLLPRWATRSPPHQSPSVTASPQGEASGLCSPTRKSVPNQGTYMGTVIAHRPEQCAPPRQNERVGTSGP